MGIAVVILLAFGMSMDAFAAALVRGSSTRQNLTFSHILRIGAVFGLIEMCAPLLGFALGSIAADFIHEWDHWVAFILLTGLGLRMIYESINQNNQEKTSLQVGSKQGKLMLIATAIGTSIDSVIVGVGLAFLSVNVWFSALFIGLASTIMATLGLWLGRFLGKKIGKWAEICGGLVLIIIGSGVLLTHTGWIV